MSLLLWLNSMQPFKTVNVLDVSFPLLDYEQTLNVFDGWVESREAHQVCIANVHTVITCLDDLELREINHRSLVTMDGLPLVWYAKWVHGANASRVCGPDLMSMCLDVGRAKAWKHFFLGGTQVVLDDLVSKTQQKYPGVEITGCYSPPFRAMTAEEDQQLVDLINASGADFLWVGLGAPKQEKWIAAHLNQLNIPVQLGVGAAFGFHSGHVPRAPAWMRNSGLEWVYRMCKDRRLIKRYLATNPLFVLLFLRDLFLKPVPTNGGGVNLK